MAEKQSLTKNPRTGLIEGFHSHYKVPEVHQNNIRTLRFGGQATAVHIVPLSNGLTLDFYARLQKSDELIVTLPGAASPNKNFYPLFWRVSTFRTIGTPAFMTFADPTLMLDKEHELRLSWVLGGPGWDPAADIIRAIRMAKGKCGAKHVAFVGGSGGGFAALRLSAMIPGSLAFIQEPQTNLAKYYRGVVEAYFNKVWPGWNYRKLINAFPERFDMVRHYKAYKPQNFVYYTQSVDDVQHREKHYKPFKAVYGVTNDSGQSKDLRGTFNLYKGTHEGHGRITKQEFRDFFDDAMRFWRENR